MRLAVCLLAAIACLSLCAQRHARAERFYRQALAMASTYGEARLGLGVTLALCWFLYTAGRKGQEPAIADGYGNG